MFSAIRLQGSADHLEPLKVPYQVSLLSHRLCFNV